VQTCQRSFDKPMVMTLAERPYTILQVNKLWEDMTGYKAEDVVGKTSCQVLQGQETDRNALDTLMTAVRFKRPAFGLLVNYTRTGERFHNHVTFYPLSTDSKITHYFSLTTHTDVIGGPGTVDATPNPPSVPVASQHVTKPQPLMSQSMVLPGTRTTPLLGGALTQGGAPIMPHPPLEFFAPQAMPMRTILPPIAGPPTAASATASTLLGGSRSRNELSRDSASTCLVPKNWFCF
jgi:PAS domain S-box-containing protein